MSNLHKILDQADNDEIARLNVAYPIGRWVLDKRKENKSFEIIAPKLHRKGKQYLNYGLKIFP